MTPRDTVAEAHRRYRHAVERAAVRILHDRDEAGDVASEAFLAMLERGPDDRQAALAWLLTTARNRALNVVRDRRRAARRPLDLPEVPGDPAVPDRHRHDLVARALSALSERDQAAVLMRYVAEASPAEIADALEVTVPVARVIVHRATKRLRAETVSLLADHHGATGACAERLRKASAGIPAGHDGCGACSAVADEIAALATHSIIPIVAIPAVRHAAARLRDAVATLKPHLNGFESRAAEAAAVLLIATGLVTPALPAAGNAPVAERSAQIPVPVAQAISQQTQPAASAARVGSRVSAATTMVTDAEGDTNTLVGPPAGVHVLGRTIRLPDPLNRSAERGHDIRSFAVYTESGSDGRPETLVFMLGMAGAIPRNAYYTVQWIFEGTGCTGEASAQTASDAYGAETSTLTVSCPEPIPALTDVDRKPAYWSETLSPSFTGTVVEWRIPLSRLDDDLREYFAPGATLSGLFATSSAGIGLSYSGVDQAPDDSTGLRYTIEER